MPSLSTTISTQEGASLVVSRRSSVDLAPSPSSIVLRCPACGKDGSAHSYESLAANHEPIACPACSFTNQQEAGIWSALPPARHRYFARFVQDYEHVRKQEGRGAASPEFYLELPFHDLTGRNT